MNQILNEMINEQVNYIFRENQLSLAKALTTCSVSLDIDKDNLQLVLNAIRISMVYSIQTTMENLMALGVLSLDEAEMRKALLKFRSNP